MNTAGEDFLFGRDPSLYNWYDPTPCRSKTWITESYLVTIWGLARDGSPHFSVTRIKTYDLNVLRAYICIQGSFKLVYIFMRQKLENVLGIVLYLFFSRAVFTLLG